MCTATSCAAPSWVPRPGCQRLPPLQSRGEPACRPAVVAAGHLLPLPPLGPAHPPPSHRRLPRPPLKHCCAFQRPPCAWPCRRCRLPLLRLWGHACGRQVQQQALRAAPAPTWAAQPPSDAPAWPAWPVRGAAACLWSPPAHHAAAHTRCPPNPFPPPPPCCARCHQRAAKPADAPQTALLPALCPPGAPALQIAVACVPGCHRCRRLAVQPAQSCVGSSGQHSRRAAAAAPPPSGAATCSEGGQHSATNAKVLFVN